MNGWQFDLASALLGAAMASALVGLGYSLREPLRRGWQEVQATFRRILGRITASVEERYRERVIDWAQKAHALAMLGPLDQFFLPPRLSPPPPHPDPEQEELPTRELIPLGVGLRGHPRLLLVGPVGSGRTTLLAYLALVHARREAGPALGLPTERIPLYLHLLDLEGNLQDERDSVELLAQQAVGAVGAPSASAKVIEQHLNQGTTLVLIDGWDELSRPTQKQATAWLSALIESLPDNLWVVAVGRRGYGPLTELGFVPLRLEQWTREEVEALLKRGADTLPQPEAGEEAPSLPPHAADALAGRLNQEPSLLDLALGVWLLLTTGEVPDSRGELFSQALKLLSGPAEEGEMELPSIARSALEELAMRSYQEDRTLFSEEEVRAAVEAALPPLEEPPSRIGSQVLKALTRPGSPLSLRGTGRFAFSHPLWWAWSVARQATNLPTATLVERLDDPRWLLIVDFYAEHGQMEPVIEAWLSKPDDLWRTRLRTAARWATIAPPSAPWRNGVMVLLARAFLAPSLPADIRERLGEALVYTRDPGVEIFLRQAFQHPREKVRAAAATAMGLINERADLSMLIKALEDPHEIVRAAAARALGRIGSAGAIDRLAATLMTAEEDTLRIEAARGLALAGKDGWEVLREAIGAEDFMTRRAAAFGLGEVKASWARPLLERVVREDGEWIVRSAASTVLAAFEQARPVAIDPPPDPSQTGWLITWAAERGEGVGIGKAAFAALLRALEEGKPPIRRAAAHMLGLVGQPEHAEALRRAVDDPEPEVAQTALWALEELAARYDLYIQ